MCNNNYQFKMFSRKQFNLKHIIKKVQRGKKYQNEQSYLKIYFIEKLAAAYIQCY